MSRSEAPETLYHPIPQGPVAINPVLHDVDDSDEVTLAGASPSNSRLDKRIRWVHFVLGCAVLLPWNGTARPFFLKICSLMNPFASNDNRNSIFPVETSFFSSQTSVQLLPVQLIHRCQLWLPCPCNSYLQTGRTCTCCMLC